MSRVREMRLKKKRDMRRKRKERDMKMRKSMRMRRTISIVKERIWSQESIFRLEGEEVVLGRMKGCNSFS